MKALRAVKYTVRALLIALVGVLLAYNIYVLVARYAFGIGMPTVFGVGFASVGSGSMEPELGVGDFIVTRAQDSYERGDIITFYDSARGQYVTHRIILVSGDTYATQGDANDAPDPFSVPLSAVVGKVVLSVSGLGAFVSFMQTPGGMFAAAGVGILVWVVTDVISGAIDKRKSKKEKGKENGNDGRTDC